MFSCDQIIDSNPSLKEFCSHDSLAGQKDFVLINALTLGLKCCSVARLSKEACLIFRGCRNAFQNKAIAADLGG